MSDCERRILTHRAHFCLQNYEWDYKRCQHCPFKSKYGGKFEAHMFNNHNDGFSKIETEGDDEEQDVRKTKVSENESVRKIKHEPALSQTIGAEKNVNVWLHECADCPFKTISERNFRLHITKVCPRIKLSVIKVEKPAFVNDSGQDLNINSVKSEELDFKPKIDNPETMTNRANSTNIKCSKCLSAFENLIVLAKHYSNCSANLQQTGKTPKMEGIFCVKCHCRFPNFIEISKHSLKCRVI